MDYFNIYLLTFFNNKTLKANQLIHVLNGKRTPSTLFFIEKNNLHPLFRLAPHMTIEELEQSLNELVTEDYLEKIQSEYRLTKEGKSIIADFEKNEKIYHVSHLLWNSFSEEFFQVWQFLTQIYSEVSYKNNKYRPLIKDFSVQQWIKDWLHSQSYPIDEQSELWSEELIVIFENLSSTEADFLSSHLTGHQHAGDTIQKIMMDLNWSKDQYNIHLKMLLYHVMDFIYFSKDLLLHHDLLEKELQNNNYGLSYSALQTMNHLFRGEKFITVAQKRRLKIGTVYEHLLEAALIDKEFNFEPFLPLDDPRLAHLYKIIHEDPLIKYQEIKEKVPDLLFVEYRLMQLWILREGEIND